MDHKAEASTDRPPKGVPGCGDCETYGVTSCPRHSPHEEPGTSTPPAMSTPAQLHVLLAEVLRCLEDGRLDAVRRKVAYADVLVCELEEDSLDPTDCEGSNHHRAPGALQCYCGVFTEDRAQKG